MSEEAGKQQMTVYGLANECLKADLAIFDEKGTASRSIQRLEDERIHATLIPSSFPPRAGSIIVVFELLNPAPEAILVCSIIVNK